MNFDLSLVIPTYNEKENIRDLIDQILDVFQKNSLRGKIIIVDDNSPDGTGAIADELAKKHGNIIVLHREGKGGLSSAVLEGFDAAQGNIFGVMDADLSHPPEKIPDLLSAIQNGADLAIGSRYVPGGNIVGWGWYRKLQSRVAIFLSQVFTPARDTMTGFFLVRKSCLDGARLNPKGFKILLEVLVKAKCARIIEVPITFTDRTRGKSKADMTEILGLLSNLLGYAKHKPRVIQQFVQFGLVGIVGMAINILALYIFTDIFGVYYITSAVIAFSIAVIFNFILNKLWTFQERITDQVGLKFVRFVCVSVVGLGINVAILYVLVEFANLWYIGAQIIAIGIAFIANFLGNAAWTFFPSPKNTNTYKNKD